MHAALGGKRKKSSLTIRHWNGDSERKTEGTFPTSGANPASKANASSLQPRAVRKRRRSVLTNQVTNVFSFHPSELLNPKNEYPELGPSTA